MTGNYSGVTICTHKSNILVSANVRTESLLYVSFMPKSRSWILYYKNEICVKQRFYKETNKMNIGNSNYEKVNITLFEANVTSNIL